MSTYVCSDLHGQYWAWDAIKNILKPEDKLFFLGDAIDRGPYGIKIMLEIMRRPNTVYIIGNHEDMMARAMENDSDAHDWHRCWMNNGGYITQYAYEELENEDKEYIRKRLKELAPMAMYENEKGILIYMNHAGYLAQFEKRISYEELPEIWDRRHFMTDGNTYCDRAIMVHGHTPIVYLMDDRDDMRENIEGAYWYSNKHKCCVDCGVHFTDQTVLMDLDTFKEYVIKREGTYVR